MKTLSFLPNRTRKETDEQRNAIICERKKEERKLIVTSIFCRIFLFAYFLLSLFNRLEVETRTRTLVNISQKLFIDVLLDFLFFLCVHCDIFKHVPDFRTTSRRTIHIRQRHFEA